MKYKKTTLDPQTRLAARLIGILLGSWIFNLFLPETSEFRNILGGIVLIVIVIIVSAHFSNGDQ